MMFLRMLHTLVVAWVTLVFVVLLNVYVFRMPWAEAKSIEHNAMTLIIIMAWRAEERARHHSVPRENKTR